MKNPFTILYFTGLSVLGFILIFLSLIVSNIPHVVEGLAQKPSVSQVSIEIPKEVKVDTAVKVISQEIKPPKVETVPPIKKEVSKPIPTIVVDSFEKMTPDTSILEQKPIDSSASQIL